MSLRARRPGITIGSEFFLESRTPGEGLYRITLLDEAAERLAGFYDAVVWQSARAATMAAYERRDLAGFTAALIAWRDVYFTADAAEQRARCAAAKGAA